MPNLTVSKVAKAAGVSSDTVRYYERLGLIPEAERSAGGYRLYESDAYERLVFIKGAQRFGLRLEEIKELLRIRDGGGCPCGHTEALLKRRVGEMSDEIARLTTLHNELTKMLENWHNGERDSFGNIWHCTGDLVSADLLFAPRLGCVSEQHSMTNGGR